MPATHPTKKELVSEFRRAGILKAARKVFARHGYEGATMDDVAEACSIAKGTLYLYFKSKKQIYLGVLREDIERLRETTGRAMDKEITPRAKIRAFVQSRIEFCALHRDFFRIYNSDISAILMAAKPSQKELRDFYFEQAGKLADVIADGIRAGELRPVPVQAAAFAIYDITRATIARQILSSDQQSAAGVTDVILELVWRGIATSETVHA